MQKVIDIEGVEGKLSTIIMPVDNNFLKKGIAVIVHPNPQQGGLNTNKVVQTIAKSLNKLGYYCFLPNLRGVGNSDGSYDFGKGEVDDVVSVIKYSQTELGYDLPIILAGFSFGAYVSTFVAHKVKIDRLILVGAAVNKYEILSPNVPNPDKTLLIHGYDDDVILLDDVVKWSESQNIVIIIIHGTGHFFHGKLLLLDKIITRFMYDIE